jgi:hypothetical protein
MKKMIVSAFMLAAVATVSYAKTATTANTITIAADDDNKTKVDPATLPDAVKTTLGGDAYKGWTVSNAWVVKAEPAYYTVELKNGDKTTTVNVGADGKVK